MYYVAFVNPNNDSRYVSFWMSARISAYVAGQNVTGMDFDIADFALNFPANGTSTSIPVQFGWTRRANHLPGEQYAWGLSNQAGTEVCLSPLTTGATYILTSQQAQSCGLTVRTTYTWYVYAVTNGDWNQGYGATFGERSISFTSTLLAYPMPVKDMLAGTGGKEPTLWSPFTPTR